MRNKYSKQFEDEMYKIGETKTLNELLVIAVNKYKYQISRSNLQNYLLKRHIRYKGCNVSKSKRMSARIPIGTERIKPDGMVQIKVASNEWKYKQRYIYEKHYGIELSKGTMIIFLDGDRTNFDIDNLMAVTTKEYNWVKNKDLVSNNSAVTKTAILSARLSYKIKEIG